MFVQDVDEADREFRVVGGQHVGIGELDVEVPPDGGPAGGLEPGSLVVGDGAAVFGGTGPSCSVG